SLTLDVWTQSVRLVYLALRPRPRFTLFPYTTLFRSRGHAGHDRSAARWEAVCHVSTRRRGTQRRVGHRPARAGSVSGRPTRLWRSEEHTSELQSRSDLVCRLLLEKKKRRLIT